MRRLPNISSCSIRVNVFRYRESVVLYRGALAKEVEMGDARSRLRVEIDSTEALIVGIGFSLVHREALAKHSIIAEYSVGPDWLCFQDLVLLDKVAVEAAVAVAGYLRQQSGKPTIFSLQEQAGTLDLARRFSSQDATLLKILEEEQDSASARIADRWRLVQSMQDTVRKLNRELATLEEKYRALRDKGYEKRSYSEDTRYKQLPTTIQQKEYAIKDAVKPPKPLLLPLPASTDKAKEILFFAHMPRCFQSLSRMAMMVQQIFLPSKVKRSTQSSFVSDDELKEMLRKIKVDKPRNGRLWEEYHDKAGAVRCWKTTKVPKSLIKTFAVGKIPTKCTDVAPFSNDVMQYSGEGAGVWYPDGLSTMML